MLDAHLNRGYDRQILRYDNVKLDSPSPWCGDSIHHARKVTSYLEKHRRLGLLYGARYSPHDNPVERIRAGPKNYVANTAVSWPGRLRQIHSFFRARSPD